MRATAFGGLAMVLATLAIPTPGRAGYDAAGDIVPGSGAGPGSTTGAASGKCGTCPKPTGEIWGVTHRAGDLWVVAGEGLLRLQGCAVIESVPLAGILVPVGLGYDSFRNVFIVTDPARDSVYQVSPAGAIVGSWPSPGAGPVGAAYDPGRDVYWISDWIDDSISPFDPETGEAGPAIPSPAGSRIAGAGFDPVADALLYNARDQSLTVWMSASDGSVLSLAPNPGGPGINNGRGTSVAPDGNGWLGHFERATLYCVEGLETVGTDSATWGQVKAGYR